VTSAHESALITEAWSAIGAGARTESSIAPPEIDGAAGALPSNFAVQEIATTCVAVAMMAAAELQEQRNGSRPVLALDREHVAFAVRSERYFRRGSESLGAGFAPLSRFWEAADGWVRTHANYPWHRAALLNELGVPDDADAVARAIAQRPALEIEERVFGAGGIAAAVRTLEEWRALRQGAAVADEPLVSSDTRAGAAARVRGACELPAAGVRVLDMTRVIAGPVCTRYLGALGAEVLRIDPPGHLDMALGAFADTLLAKRSTLLDASDSAGTTAVHTLLQSADVLVAGYRPHALDRFGLAVDRLAEQYPGLVIVVLDAWGHSGPWSARRGFDSVVQAPTGIAHGEQRDGAPGALPCQLLDHGTGYLAAAAALDGLCRQSSTGGTPIRRLSLARTAAWVAQHPASTVDEHEDRSPRSEWIQRMGDVDAIAPPGALAGRALQWPTRLTRYGADAPHWSDA
jgi:crotonobetainyl-CoA:carnitine CoA-transferase CaiB-like acyl-CoA transferase